MSAPKPKRLFWVEMKLTGTVDQNSTAAYRGAKGGKVSSLEAAIDRKKLILQKAEGRAEVTIFMAETAWVEVSGNAIARRT